MQGKQNSSKYKRSTMKEKERFIRGNEDQIKKLYDRYPGLCSLFEKHCDFAGVELRYADFTVRVEDMSPDGMRNILGVQTAVWETETEPTPENEQKEVRVIFMLYQIEYTEFPEKDWLSNPEASRKTCPLAINGGKSLYEQFAIIGEEPNMVLVAVQTTVTSGGAELLGSSDRKKVEQDVQVFQPAGC